MNKQLVDALMARLDALSHKLGVAAQFLWKAELRQARIVGVEYLVFSLLALCGLLTCCWGFVRVWRWGSNPNASREDREGAAPSLFFIFIGILICLWLLDCTLTPAITGLCNPGYWAFHDLLRQL